MKKLLGFDTTNSDIKIYFGDEKEIKKYLFKNLSSTENLLKKIDDVLKENNTDVEDIDVFAVNVGPGSWTGIRVGIVTCMGLMSAFANKKVIEFNNFQLIESSIKNYDKKNITIVVPAYSNYVYIKNEDEINCVEKESLKKKRDIYSDSDIEDLKIKKVDLEEAEFLRDKLVKEEFSDLKNLQPMYVKPSQAELQLKNKNKI